MAASFADHDAFFDDVDPASTAPGTPSSIDPEADAFFTDEQPIDLPADNLLRRLRDFTVSHAQRLADMRESLSDTLSEAWHEENDTIALNMTAADGLAVVSIVSSDNVQLNKVVLALAACVSELRGMVDIAESKFYGPLTQFGHKYSEHVLAKPANHSTAPSTTASTASPSASPTTAAASANADFTPPTSLSQLPTLEQEFGLLLPTLSDLSNYLTRLFGLTTNLLTQLGCLYHERQKLFVSTYSKVRLDYVFDTIGLAGRICLTLDAIINDNEMIEKGWTAYRKMIKYIRNDTNKYAVAVQQLRLFESLLLNLDKQILSVSIFQSLLELPYGQIDSSSQQQQQQQQQSNKALIEGNKVLYEQFNLAIKSAFKRLTSGLGDEPAATAGTEKSSLASSTYDRLQLVDLYALYALFRHLFHNTTKVDKKLFNELWLVQKRVPLILLYGRATFLIPEFMGKYTAIEAKSVQPPIGKAILTTRMQLLQEMDDRWNERVEEMYGAVSVWCVRMESALKITSAHPVHTVLTTRGKLLVTGVLLARKLRELLVTNLYLHLKLNVSFRAKNIRSIAIACELLKTLQQCYVKRQGMISEHFNLIIGQSTFILKHLIHAHRKRVSHELQQHSNSKRNSANLTMDGKLDQLAALSLAYSQLEQPPTPERLSVIQLCCQIGLQERMYAGGSEKGEKTGEEVRYQLYKLSMLSQYQQLVDGYTNCSFLYWLPNLIPVFLKDIFDFPSQVNRLSHLLLALEDIPTLFAGCERSSRLSLKHELTNELLHYLNQEIVLPLCREVETDLRLHIHSVVLHQMQLRGKVIRDVSRFFTVGEIRLLDEVIDLKWKVGHYLDLNFYNLNTVALHDWRVYAEMRNLALEKYNLHLTEVYLPGTSHYSENLDILEMMRNIHIFVTRYNYNMNTQLFIERVTDQKHITTLNIYHVADSLRTHGTGVMNTTINFTYQFLVRKSKIVSEFLFDDHIKSKLIKLYRHFRDTKHDTNSRFSYEAAEKFNREVKKLGVSSDGSTFIDHFRRQVTEIGNALGYVRMVRSGGLQYMSANAQFCIDLNERVAFEEEVRAEGISTPSTLDAARNLDSVIRNLIAQFTSESNYFSVLVSIFEPVLNSPEQKHLQNFYLILPSLFINYIESLKAMKEKLMKQSGRQEVAWTDDGFVLGVAYLLRVLHLDGLYDSLHWFDSVKSYTAKRREEYGKELDKLRGGKGVMESALKQAKRNDKAKPAPAKGGKAASAAAAAGGDGDEEDEEVAQLSVQVRKWAAMAREFELLFYTFSGARIFFQSDEESDAAATVDGKTEEKKELSTDNAASAPAASQMDGGLMMGGDVPMAPPI